MEQSKGCEVITPDVTAEERAALLGFFEENYDDIRTKMVHGPIGIQLRSGRIISFFTYSDFLDCLSQLRASAPAQPSNNS